MKFLEMEKITMKCESQNGANEKQGIL